MKNFKRSASSRCDKERHKSHPSPARPWLPPWGPVMKRHLTVNILAAVITKHFLFLFIVLRS